MNKYHIAQINVGTTLYPTDDPRLAGFMNRLDDINALADRSAGFVWRLQSESGNATDIDVGGPPLFIINMSVWESVEALYEFVYKTVHRNVMADRREWFQKPQGAYQALWWVAAGHLPSVEEGLAKLELLKSTGPSSEVFTFKTQFPQPGSEDTPKNLNPETHCSGWS